MPDEVLAGETGSGGEAPMDAPGGIPNNYADYLKEKSFILKPLVRLPVEKKAELFNAPTQFLQDISNDVKDQFDKISQPDMLNLSNTIANFNADKIQALTNTPLGEDDATEAKLNQPKLKELAQQAKDESNTEIKNWGDIVGKTVPVGTIIRIDDDFKNNDVAFLNALKRGNPTWTGEYLQMQHKANGTVVPKAYNMATAFMNTPTALVGDLSDTTIFGDKKISDEDAKKWYDNELTTLQADDQAKLKTGEEKFGDYVISDRLKDANLPTPAIKLLMNNKDLYENFKEELNKAEGSDVVGQGGQMQTLAKAVAKTYDFDKAPNQDAYDALANANGLRQLQFQFNKKQNDLAAKIKVIGEANIDPATLNQYTALQTKLLTNPSEITEEDRRNYAAMTMQMNDQVAKSGSQNAQQLWGEYQNNNKQFATILKQTPQLLAGAATPEGQDGINTLLKQQKGQYLINIISRYFPDIKAAEDKQASLNKDGSDILSAPKSLYSGAVGGVQSVVKGATNMMGGDRFEAMATGLMSNKGEFENNTNFLTPDRPTDTNSTLANFWNGVANTADAGAKQIGQMALPIAMAAASGGSSLAELTPFALQGYHDTELQMRRAGVPQNYAEGAGLINAALTMLTMKFAFMPAKILQGKIENIGMKELLDQKFTPNSIMDYFAKFLPTKGDAQNAAMGIAQGLAMQISDYVQNKETNQKFGTQLNTDQLTPNNILTNAASMAGITYALGTISKFGDKKAATQLALKYADENPVMFATALDNAKNEAMATGRFDINRINELQANVARFYLKQHGMPLGMNSEQHIAAFDVLDKISALKSQLEHVDTEFKAAIEQQIKDAQKTLHEVSSDTKAAEKHNAKIVDPAIKELEKNGYFNLPAKPKFEENKPIEVKEGEQPKFEDNKQYTFTVNSLDEIPSQFKDRAQKAGEPIKSRKKILGIPYGKETISQPYKYTITGKEAKDVVDNHIEESGKPAVAETSNKFINDGSQWTHLTNSDEAINDILKTGKFIGRGEDLSTFTKEVSNKRFNISRENGNSPYFQKGKFYGEPTQKYLIVAKGDEKFTPNINKANANDLEQSKGVGVLNPEFRGAEHFEIYKRGEDGEYYKLDTKEPGKGAIEIPKPPAIKGEPENITKPIELSTEQTDAEYKPQIRDDYFADKHFNPDERAKYDKLDEVGKDAMIDEKRKQLDEGAAPQEPASSLEDLNDENKIKSILKRQWDAANNGELKDNEGQPIQGPNNGIASNGLEALTNKKWGHGSDRLSAKESLKAIDDLMAGADFKGWFGRIKNPEGGMNVRDFGAKFVVVTDNPENIHGNALTETKGTSKLDPLDTEIILNDALSPFGQALKNKYPKFIIKDYNGKQFEAKTIELPNTQTQAGIAEQIPAPISQETAGGEKGIAAKGAELAAKLRKFKSKPDQLNAHVFGVAVGIYDGAIETVATAIEKGSELAEAIQHGIEYMRKRSEKFDEEGFRKHIEDAAAGEKPKIKVQVGRDSEAKPTGIKHAATEEIRAKHGLGDYERTPTTDEALREQAKARIDAGEDIEKLLQKTEAGHPPTGVENEIFKIYGAGLEKQVADNPSDENLAKLQRFVKALDKAGTQASEQLRTRKGLAIQDESLAGFFVREQHANNDAPLTTEQKQTVLTEHENISEAQAKFDEKVKALEAENAKLKAEKELNKQKATAKKPENKTHEDYVKERKDIAASIKEKWKKAGNSGELHSDIPYRQQLFAIAPDVAKLAKSLIEEGVDKLGDVVKSIHETLKEDMPDIQEKDIHDILAGEYNKPKPLRKDVAAKLFDLKTEAQLINKLEALQRGEKPTNERQRIKRNQQIEALRKQIKDLQKEMQDGKTPQEIALKTIKTRTQNEITKIEEQLKTGDFDETVKEPVKLDKEAMDLKDKLLQLKEDRELRLMKQEFEQEKLFGKKGIRYVGQALNTGRVLKSSFDVSMPFRQGLWGLAKELFSAPSFKNGKLSFNQQKVLRQQFGKMYEALGSESASRRIMADIHESPRFELAQESGLNISEPTSLISRFREDAYGASLVEKIPFLGKPIELKGNIPVFGNKVGGLVKASERAATTFVNQMKWDIFNGFVDIYEKQGKTFDNAKEDYQAAADYANQAVGRGKLGENLERANAITSRLFFSLRLQASRLQLMSNFANPRFYKKASPELRQAYFKDMAKFVTLGMTSIAIAKALGLSVGVNPFSSEFGKIKIGKTTIDVWGGFQQWATFFMKEGFGERAVNEVNEPLDTDKGHKTRFDIAEKMVRSKTSPEAGLVWDLLAGRDFNGDPVTPSSATLNYLVPLIGQDIKNAYDDGGLKLAMLIAILSAHGVSTQTYTDRPPTQSKSRHHNRRVINHRK